MSQTKQPEKICFAYHQGYSDKTNGLPYNNTFKKEAKKAYKNGFNNATCLKKRKTT